MHLFTALTLFQSSTSYKKNCGRTSSILFQKCWFNFILKDRHLFKKLLLIFFQLNEILICASTIDLLHFNPLRLDDRARSRESPRRSAPPLDASSKRPRNQKLHPSSSRGIFPLVHFSPSPCSRHRLLPAAPPR